MAEVTYKYTAVTDVSSAWTSEANVTDADETNYAYDLVDKNSTGGLLIGTANTCPGTDLGTITKVEMIMDVGCESGEASYMDGLIAPLFGGTLDGDTRTADLLIGATPEKFTYDITTDTNAPGTWTWSDIQDLDLQTRGDNNASSNDIYYYCYVMWVRVTYTPAPTGANKNILTGFNF